MERKIGWREQAARDWCAAMGISPACYRVLKAAQADMQDWIDAEWEEFCAALRKARGEG